MLPLFADLHPYLDEVWQMAKPGEKYFIARYRNTMQNLRTQLQRIIKRANLTSCPKLWQNLRASRQTELEQDCPTYVVCQWLGNTPTIANKHYLTVTEEHYVKAVQFGGQTGDKLGTQPPVTPCNQSHEKTRTPHAVRKNATFAEVVGILKNPQVAKEGLEPPKTPEKTHILRTAQRRAQPLILQTSLSTRTWRRSSNDGQNCPTWRGQQWSGLPACPATKSERPRPAVRPPAA